jgi:hypothetical protein
LNVRRIKIDPPDDSKWKKWIADCQTETADVSTIVGSGGKPEFKADLYGRKSIKSNYFFNKDGPFFGKCAYCEAYITDFQHGDVEHFRPKAMVTDENDQIIYLTKDDGTPELDSEGKHIKHPGYYWLAYEWTNLLPSCIVCNQRHRKIKDISKANRFPVDGKHARKPEDTANEKPLLINPATGLDEDDPKLHLKVDPGTGIMAHLTSRGEMCIKVFGLNQREQLTEDRKRAYRDAQALITKFLDSKDQSALEEWNKIKEGRRSYSMAANSALQECEARLQQLSLSSSS